MAYYLGIDIGSRTSKGVVIGDGELLACHVLPSGVNYKEAAGRLRAELLDKMGLSALDIAAAVATGQGSGNIPFPAGRGTDIRCCARGVHSIFPSARTVIDVQAQSSQVIKVGGSGRVTGFAVSEKCAAGSGRFMEVIANVLQVELKDIGPLSLKAKSPVAFSTGCAVFGESEAVSRVAEGAAREDILAGVHRALADKISALADKVGLEADCALSGGGGLDTGLIRAVEERLGVRLLLPPHPQIVTALGAAIMAGESVEVPDD